MLSKTLRCLEGPFDSFYTNKIIRARSMTPIQHLNEIAELSAAGNAFAAFISVKYPPKKPLTKNINIDIIRSLKNEFDKYNIDTVVGGDIAAMIFIPPRSTRDITINIRTIPDTIITKDNLYNVISKIDGIDIGTFIYTDTRVPKKYSNVTPRNVFATFKYYDSPIDTFIYNDGNVRSRVFSSPIIVDDLKFAPPECICVWKMMSYEKDRRYNQDRADIISLLQCVKIDIDWVRQQLIIHDGTEKGVRVTEWDELQKFNMASDDS